MMMMLMQMNPQLLQQLGGGHQKLMKELERMEKAKDIQVRKGTPTLVVKSTIDGLH